MEKRITIDQVMGWRPCGFNGPHNGENYTRQRVVELWDGRAALSPQDIAALDIPPRDKLWALLHLLTEEQTHLAACSFAEAALVRERDVGREPHPDSWRAIEVKRAWVRGDATDEELSAARGAARAASDAAARTADAAAACPAWAAWAARGAARAAAWAARTAAAWAADADAAWAAAAAWGASDAAARAAWAAARTASDAAAWAASDAVWAAAWAADADAAAWTEQLAILLQYITE